jgi:phosphohistidine swiveling domain-containing protein
LETQSAISIEYDQAEKANGLGLMIGQYLEQNLSEFEDKVKQGRKLSINTTVAADKGISTTIKFSGNRIFIQNGVSADTHLHLEGSYAVLAKVLSGTLNPAAAVIGRDIKIVKIPATKPFQAIRLLNFLKIPEELLVNGNAAKAPVLTWQRIMIAAGVAACGFSAVWLLMQTGWM